MIDARHINSSSYVSRLYSPTVQSPETCNNQPCSVERVILFRCRLIRGCILYFICSVNLSIKAILPFRVSNRMFVGVPIHEHPGKAQRKRSFLRSFFNDLGLVSLKYDFNIREHIQRGTTLMLMISAITVSRFHAVPFN